MLFNIILTVVIVTDTFFERRDHRHCGGGGYVPRRAPMSGLPPLPVCVWSTQKSAGRSAIVVTRFPRQQYIRAIVHEETIVQIAVVLLRCWFCTVAAHDRWEKDSGRKSKTKKTPERCLGGRR